MNDEEPLATLFKPGKEELDSNAILASKFITALFAPYDEGYVDFRSLYPQWSEEYIRGQNRDDELWTPTHSMRFVRFPAQDVIAEYVRRHAWSKDCYFGVLPRAEKSGKLESVTQAAWLWCDIDAKQGGHDAAMAVLTQAMQESSLPCPSIITDSRNGIHAFWALHSVVKLPDHRARQVFTSVLKVLASWIGSFGDVKADPAVTNVNAILRISGTYNLKREHEPFRVVSFAPPARSAPKSYAWWQENIPGYTLPVEYKPREAGEVRVLSKFKTTKRGQDFLDNPPASGRHDALKLILGGSVYYGNGADVLDALAIQFSSASGLPQAEALRLARHFDRQRNGH